MNHARWRSTNPLILLVLLGLALRLFWLDKSPLRGDEAFAIQYWAAPWPAGLALTTIEPHPYGTFALFALWRAAFGDGEWVMRLLPALLSLPGLTAIAVAGRRLFKSHKAGLLAALLYGVHPFLIWHAQDARNYAIWATTCSITLVLFLRAIESKSIRAWLGYSAAALFSAYVFFFAIFFIAAEFVYLFLLHRAQWRRWLLSSLVITVGLIPWMLQILTIMRGGEYGGTAGAFQLLQLFTWFLPTFVFGSTLPAAIVAWLWPVVLVLTCVGLFLIGRRHPATAVLLVMLLIIPVAMLWMASTRMDIFRPRYLMPLAPVMVLLISGAYVSLTTRNMVSRSIVTLGLVGLLALDGIALIHYHTDPAFAKAPDWRRLGQFLSAQVSASDLVIQQTLDPAFTYYFRGPGDETSLPRRANPPAEETIAYLEAAVERYTALWLLPADIPWWDAEHVPQTWLEDNLQTTTELDYTGFHILRFQPWQVNPDELQRDMHFCFGTSALLRDWQVDRLDSVSLRLTVYWEPLANANASLLHGFAHLIGPAQPANGQPVWAQDDHPVTHTNWEPGVLRRDVYHIPLPATPPAGEWALHLGLYSPQTLERVPVGAADHITIPLTQDFLSATQSTDN